MDLTKAGFLISCFIFSFKLEREEERPNEKDYFQKKKNALVCLSFQVIPGIF